MTWRLFDLALTWACVALLVHFGGLPAGLVGAAWACWNYADGTLDLSRRRGGP